MIGDRWRALAFAPPRVLGAPPASGRLRVVPEDFVVEEVLGFAPEGHGQHVLLKVTKRGANTEWVARELARAARCAAREVGYAGLKDRNAVTTQWFTVPAAALPAGGWVGFAGPEFTVLEAFAHHRKLPRGALSENRFLIRIRNCEADRSAVHARLERLAAQGVANYFGAQRFGRAGANLAAAAAAAAQGAALRARRSAAGGFALSAARSLIFNAVLAARIADGSWSSIEPGDIAILDGRGSVFAVDATDAALLERCRMLEVHPSGPLWGRAEPSTRARIGALERAIGLEFQELAAWLAAAGLEHERRSLRLRVRALQHRWEDQDLILEFALGPGSFATAVLREIVTTAQEGEESAGSS